MSGKTNQLGDALTTLRQWHKQSGLSSYLIWVSPWLLWLWWASRPLLSTHVLLITVPVLIAAWNRSWDLTSRDRGRGVVVLPISTDTSTSYLTTVGAVTLVVGVAGAWVENLVELSRSSLAAKIK